MTEYEKQRDAAAEQHAERITSTLIDADSRARYFRKGADWATFQSPIVLALVEALKHTASSDHNLCEGYGECVYGRDALAAFNKAKESMK